MRWIAAACTGCMACLIATSAWALSPFLIFFNSGSDRLDARALAILDNAAEGVRSGDVRQLTVSGFADRSGSFAYNLRLSYRRAEAVKAALVSRGVPARIITVEAFGEGRLLVETADGVSEPHNRFVTITFTKICRPLPGTGVQPSC